MKVNTISCGAYNANTGASNCPVHLKFEGAIEVPADKRFTKAEVENLATTLRALIVNNNRLLRAYPFPPFTKSDPKGGDTVNVTFDSGEEITMGENYYILNFNFYKGGVPLNNSLRTRNGSDTAFLFYGGGIIFGSMINNEYAGVPASNFWCMAATHGAFKTESKYMWKANVPTPFLNEKVWFVEDDFDVRDLTGLRNVDIYTTTLPNAITAGGVVALDVKERGYGTNYADLYPAELATVGLFTARNKATGAAITVTSTSVSNGRLSITLDTTDADYPAVGGTVTIVGPLISALTAAGILNAEIFSLDIVRTV